MERLKRILGIMLAIICFFVYIPKADLQAAGSVSNYKSYYVYEGGKHVQYRYKYPNEAQNKYIPESCFQKIGTYVYEGKLDEKSYIVHTYLDPDQGTTPSETTKYLKSEYIVWICTSDTPTLSNIGSTSYNLLSSIKVLTSEGKLSINPIDNSTPMISVELDKNNPDLITNGSRQIESNVKDTGKGVNIGNALVKLYNYGKNIEFLIKDIVSTDWQEFSQFDRKQTESNTSNTEIIAKKYVSQLDRIRAFGYTLNAGYYLSEAGNNVTLCYDITYPADTPNAYKVKERSLTTKYNFVVKGDNFKKNLNKEYKVDYTFNGDNKTNINNLIISVPAEDYYNGGEVKPKVTICHFNTEPKYYLVENEDYKVTYNNNTSIGIGNVIIEGINNYTGKVSKTFQISLSKPTNLKKINASMDSVQFSWSKVSGATGYQIYKSTDGIYFSSIASNFTGTSFEDTRLTQNRTYQYKIRAFCTNNGKTRYSDFSNILSITTNKLGTTSLKKESSSVGSIKISWSKVSGATGYQICKSTDGINFIPMKGIITGTSFENRCLSQNTTYQYKIRACYTNNGITQYSDFSNILSVKTKKLGTPSNLKKERISDTKTKISWGKVSDADGYVVYEAIDGGSFSSVGGQYVTSYKSIGMVKGHKYQFKIRAYTTKGGLKQYSDWSKVISVTK